MSLKVYCMSLICAKLWLLGNRCGIVPPYSPGSSLILYQMDGRIMHGVGLIKEYYLTNVRIKLCVEKLSLVLPFTPPYVPRMFGRCNVIGNSGDLLKTKFGREIDGYDAVVKENGAPIQVKLTAY